MIVLNTVPQLIAAVGGLGAAAFGLVDSTKAFGGGVNNIGFQGIKSAVGALTQGASSQPDILATLEANWFSGTDLGVQKSLAKSLIELSLNSTTAAVLATVTGLDAASLSAIASSMEQGIPLTAAQSALYFRFDQIVSALLDQAYQRADHLYRDGTRAWAMAISIALALIAGHMMHASLAASLLVGLSATPLAPIAKDLSTALSAAKK
jgi:hypothetical protein